MTTEKNECTYSGFKLNGFVALSLILILSAAAIYLIATGGINENGLFIGGGIALLLINFIALSIHFLI